MRVLQLHNYHFSKGGDVEVMLHERKMLEDAGHSVDEWSLPPAAEMGLSPVRAGAKAVWNREASREVGRRVQQFRPDVVHVHDPFPLMSPAVFREVSGRGVPILATQHAYRYSCIAGTLWRDGGLCQDCVGGVTKLPGLRHRCYHDSFAASAALTVSLGLHRSLGTFHKHVARYITLTEFGRRILERDGFPVDKIVVKPNSVADPGVSSGPSPDRYVVFVGRLLDIKGVRTLLNAWRDVPAGMKLRIAGDGPLRPLVEERAAADPSIEFLGWADEDQVVDLMSGAEAVLVPSEWYECLPLVILRSLAVGTPVVIPDVENLSEAVVRDGTGFTFAMRDSRDLGRVLASLAADPGRARALRDACRASYEANYSPASDFQMLEQIYRSVLPQPARAR